MFFLLPLSAPLIFPHYWYQVFRTHWPIQQQSLCVHFVWTQGLVLSQDLSPNLSHSEFSHYFKSHEQKTTRCPPWQSQQHQQILTIVCVLFNLMMASRFLTRELDICWKFCSVRSIFFVEELEVWVVFKSKTKIALWRWGDRFFTYLNFKRS